MDEATHSRNAERAALPPVSNDEREFWRRAVAAERARQGRSRPPPFPFQKA